MNASIAVLVFLLLSGRAVAQNRPPPIIDVHLHANPADAQGPPTARICAPADHWPTRDATWSSEQYVADLNLRAHCAATLVSPSSDEELMEQTLQILERRNIYAVTSGAWDWVQRWKAAAPERIIPALGFHVYNAPLDPVRRLLETDQLAVLGEVMNQFVGVAPGDSAQTPDNIEGLNCARIQSADQGMSASISP